MTRISYKEVAPGAYQAMLGLESYVGESGLEHSLLELVRTRASQLNGCAFCLDMHGKDAIAAGETPQRLIALSAARGPDDGDHRHQRLEPSLDRVPLARSRQSCARCAKAVNVVHHLRSEYAECGVNGAPEMKLPAAGTIFTIGHSTRTLDEFVALLRQVDVTLLVDVRSIPRSRMTPQFNRDTLPDSLAAEGIGYRH